MAVKAQLHIETCLRNEKSFLKSSFATQPFKLADITEDQQDKGLKLMIRSSSPGVLDGDEYDILIDIEKRTSLIVETQAYQRIFQMKQGATQTMRVNMHEHSSFSYLPHPTVPHEGSIFVAKNKIYLTDGCTLLWGEVLSCGRKLSGEVFKFTSYQNLTEIFKNGKLVVKENLLIKPAEIDMTSIGQLEGFSHQSTLIFLNEDVAVAETIKLLIDYLSLQSTIVFGVSALQINGFVVRLIGNSAEQLFDLHRNIASLIDVSTIDRVIKPVVHVS